MSNSAPRARRHRQGAELAGAGIGAVGVLRRPCDPLDVVRRRAVLLLDAAEDVERQRLRCHEAVPAVEVARQDAVAPGQVCGGVGEVAVRHDDADGDQQHGRARPRRTLIDQSRQRESDDPCSRDRGPVRRDPDDRRARTPPATGTRSGRDEGSDREAVPGLHGRIGRRWLGAAPGARIGVRRRRIGGAHVQHRATGTMELMPLDPDLAARLKRDADGLVAAVAQQWDTGEVLMLGWMDDEALRRTLTTGRATYLSRSRQEYWRKGDTSGTRPVGPRGAPRLRRRHPAGQGRPGRCGLPHRRPHVLRRGLEL